MNTIYELKFVGGPQDGLVAKCTVPQSQRIYLPCQPERQLFGRSRIQQNAYYDLNRAEYHLEEDLPGVIFHYEFRGAAENGAAPPSTGFPTNRVGQWLGQARRHLAHWMSAPVPYPLSTR